MHIECVDKWVQGETIDLTLTVLYEEGIQVEPITFHKTAFTSEFSSHSLREGFAIYRDIDGTWEKVESEESCFAIFDDPPIPVQVGDAGKFDKEFVTLHPGETWSEIFRQQSESWSNLPSEVQAGDHFKVVIRGAILDWWDFGTKEDHRETEVELPCFIAGDIEKPKDNGGRPKIVVPASNEILFTYVG